MAQNGLKWLKCSEMFMPMVQMRPVIKTQNLPIKNGEKMPKNYQKMAKMPTKWPKMAQNGLKQPKYDPNNGQIYFSEKAPILLFEKLSSH